MQALTPANEYSSRASWWPHSSGFAAQADQDQSAATSPDSEDAAETSQAAEAGASSEQEVSQQGSQEHGANAEAETISYDELEPEELRAELLQRDTALAAQAAEVSMLVANLQQLSLFICCFTCAHAWVLFCPMSLMMRQAYDPAERTQSCCRDTSLAFITNQLRHA